MPPLPFVLAYSFSVLLFSVFEYYRSSGGRKRPQKMEGPLSKCPNYEVCAGMYPDSVCEGLCSQCTAKFGKPKGGAGKLVFLPDNVYCPVCWEDKPGVKQAFCEHTLCADCFRNWYFAVADPPPAPLHEAERYIYDLTTDTMVLLPEWVNAVYSYQAPLHETTEWDYPSNWRLDEIIMSVSDLFSTEEEEDDDPPPPLESGAGPVVIARGTYNMNFHHEVSFLEMIEHHVGVMEVGVVLCPLCRRG